MKRSELTPQSQKHSEDLPKDPASTPPRWTEAHERACAQEQEFYVDPETGLWVGTRYRLLKRGYCCECGCRHCPYPKKS